MLVRVDLPIPGEPPSSTSEPGTRPPPRTRSSSPIPVDIRLTAVPPTSLSGRGAWRSPRSGSRPARAPAPARDPARACGTPPLRGCSRPRSRGTVRATWPTAGRTESRRERSCGPSAQPTHRWGRQPGGRGELSRSRLRGCGAPAEHVAPATVGHLPDALAQPHQAEPARAVQRDAGLVLGEDPSLQGPEARLLGDVDEAVQQFPADAAAKMRAVDVDRHRADPAVDTARGDRAEGCPADHLAACARGHGREARPRRRPLIPARRGRARMSPRRRLSPPGRSAGPPRTSPRPSTARGAPDRR